MRNRHFDNGDTKDTVLSPKEKFKTEVFFDIIHQLVSALKHQLGAYKEINDNFGFLSKPDCLSLSIH